MINRHIARQVFILNDVWSILAVGEIPSKFINLPANRFLDPVQWRYTYTNMADENDNVSVSTTNKRRFADITIQQLNKIVEDKDAMRVPSAPVIYNYGTMTNIFKYH